MRRTARTLLPAAGLLAGVTFAAGTAQAQFTVYGLTTGAVGGQQLVSFSTGGPSAVRTLGATGQSLVGLDFRPATGELFGYTGSQFFTLNLGTGAATPGAVLSTATGQTVAFDFNPTVDRVRIIDATAGTNLRVNPATGAVTVDAAYSFAAGDANTGTPSFREAAYTNSVAGATATALFGVDAGRGSLIRIANPNGGTVNTIGSLGLGTDLTLGGFDIVTVGTTNTAFLAVINAAATTSLYSVDLTSGATSLVGNLATGTRLQALAIAPVSSTVPEPGTLGLLAGGVTLLGGFALRRRGQTA